MLDNLQEMFDMQEILQGHLGYRFRSMTLWERMNYVKEYSIHLTQELHEMLYEIPYFKPWKNYDTMSAEEQCIAIEKAKEEYVDMWHFFMNIGIALGITPEKLYSSYMVKNKENYERQQRGYTHDIKYREEPK